MSQQAERISYLIFVYLNKTITPAEQQELDLFISSSPANERFFHQLTRQDNIQNMLAEYGEPDKSRIWQKITDKAPEVQTVALYQKKWWRYAAAAVLVLGMGSWLFLSNQAGKGKQNNPALLAQNNTRFTTDIAAGTDKAILTLSNGKMIVLDSQASGQLSLGNPQTTALLEHNKITYTNAASGNMPALLTYNTIATPRGGQYQLVLPDGTKVWINAGSFLRFPTAFARGERMVELSGEAYFEVASLYQSQAAGRTNKKIPFIVNIQAAGKPQGSIHVLGTHFNVNAYTQNDILTTLTEGKVKVVSVNDQSALLQPGEQAKLSGTSTNKNAITVTSDIDTEEVLAWKNGLFHFNNASIQTILEQVARWYDVEVVYETNTNVHFSFLLDRKMPVSRLLQILELTGSIHFKIEGKTIRVVK